MSETVFISSVIGGFEAVRQAAREAVESMGMRPLMAEMVGARPESPQHALLGEVAEADVYLLLLGVRYGEPSASGVSRPDRVAGLARATGLVSQASGIAQDVRRGGITRETGEGRSSPEASIASGEAGEVVVEGAVAGDDRNVGTSRIDPEKLISLI